MPSLVLDIETVGEPWETIDDQTQKLLIQRAQQQTSFNSTAEAKTAAEDQLGLQPLTGRIVVLGVMDVETKRGKVFYQAPNTLDFDKEFTEGECTYIKTDEKEMLKLFWDEAKKYDQFITYSGRTFDMPFIFLRSAVNGIKPTKDLMRSRYVYQQPFDAHHIDLYDQMSFYGSLSRLGGIHLACRAFGIPTPKGDISGADVGKYFRKGKYLDIARYNARDLVATLELYLKWKQYLSF